LLLLGTPAIGNPVHEYMGNGIHLVSYKPLTSILRFLMTYFEQLVI